MTFFDLDGASTVSRRSSHSHRKSTTHKSHKGSRSRSRSRTRHPGLAAFVFGSGAVKRHNSHAHNKSTSSFSLFGGGGEDKDHHHRSSQSHNRSSASFSIFGGDGDHHKHNKSTSSFFGLGNNHSRSSFFGGFGRSPSYYKRSPRPSFLQKAIKQVRRLFRDLVYYAKRHPVKVFMLVVMPLITGGFLTALLARFGLRLPVSIERMLGLAARASSGGSMGLVGEAVRMASGGAGAGGVGAGAARTAASVARGWDGTGMPWERRRLERDIGGGGSGAGSWGDSVMGWAKSFV